MTIRTTTSQISFKRPFLLPGMDAAHPAGTYGLETEEELIENVSMTAYRRIATRLLLDKNPARPGYAEELSVEPADLADALEKDIRTP